MLRRVRVYFKIYDTRFNQHAKRPTWIPLKVDQLFFHFYQATFPFSYLFLIYLGREHHIIGLKHLKELFTNLLIEFDRFIVFRWFFSFLFRDQALTQIFFKIRHLCCCILWKFLLHCRSPWKHKTYRILYVMYVPW